MVKENVEISTPQMTPEYLPLAAFIFTMVEENFEISPPQMTPE